MGNKAIDKSYLLQTLKDFTTKIISPLVGTKISEPVSEGSEGQVLTTDGNGNRTWTTVSGGSDGMATDGHNAAASVTFPNSALTIGSRGSSYDLGEKFEWEDLTSQLYSGDQSSGAGSGSRGVMYNGEIFYYAPGYTAIWKYNKKTNLWETISYNSYYSNQILYCSMITYNNKLYLLGGNSSSNNTSKCMMIYDGNNFVVYGSGLPYNFGKGAAVVYDNKIHLLGSNGNGTAHCSWDDIQSVNTWTYEQGLPYQFINGSAVVYDGKIHILGSNYANCGKKHYSWDGTSWTEESTLPYEFYDGGAVVYNDKIYIMGGGADTSTWKNCYSWDGTSWTQESALPINFQYGFAIIYTDDYGDIIYIKSERNHCYYRNNTWYSNPLNSLPYHESSGYKNVVIYHDLIRYFAPNNKIYQNNTGKKNGWIYRGSGPISGCQNYLIFQDKVYALGSGSSSNYRKFYSTSNNDIVSWVLVGSLPYDFYGGSAVVYNDKIHILGSAYSSSSSYSFAKYHYSWDGTSWTQESTLPYEFYYGDAIVYNNKIHIFGSAFSTSSTQYINAKKHYSWDGTSWTEESTLPYNFYYGSAVIYNNKIHILNGLKSIAVYNNNGLWEILSEHPPIPSSGTTIVENNTFYIFNNWQMFKGIPQSDIIEISPNEKLGTMVQGYQSTAIGDYSYARGANCLAEGNYSKAEGVNAYSLLDFQSVMKGSSKFDNGEFAFGYSLYNHVFNQGNTSETAINGEYGCSGTIVGKLNVGAYIKINPYGLYILYKSTVDGENGTMNIAFISNGIQKTVGDNTPYSAFYSYDTIYINSLSSRIQFALIRLA